MAGDDTAPLKLAVLSIAEQSLFVATLAGIFEHSPWIAEQAWDARPFADVEALHRAMLKVMWNAPTQQQLQLIRAHPELTGKEAAAGALTAHSEGEQTSAGLDRCTPEELTRLRDLNRAYREKFGFPFIMAVKNRNRAEILAAIESRLSGNWEGRVLPLPRGNRKNRETAPVRVARPGVRHL